MRNNKTIKKIIKEYIPSNSSKKISIKKNIFLIILLISFTTNNALANKSSQYNEDEENIKYDIVITSPSALEFRMHSGGGLGGGPPPFISNLALSLFFTQKKQRLRMFGGGSIIIIQDIIEYSAQNEDFIGAEGTAGLIIGDRYAAYAAINVFLALSTWCNENSKKACEENQKGGGGTMGIAPEIGLRISVYDKYYISIFSRKQISIGDLKNYTSSGIGIGYRSQY